ncbi:hypothetical protein [Nonomuraea sp. SYSU D8015]|uniref:hypothetical protein n=1 Tax=Nonomuraea sp. SYSU D8015 TaxID=2593644 RepID=UPI00166013FA|nr:hypothetical protein [Nonomuraea sp. SYSU D8015]
MSSHKIRSIIAAAALAAGISWLAAAPTDAGTCGKKRHASAECGESVEMQVDDTLPGSAKLTPEAASLALAAGRLARELGLAGLASARPSPDLLDLGGIVATWGMPSVSSASPELFPTARGPVGMEDLATEAHVPDLPSLPIPGTPLEERIPRDMTLGRGPFPNGVTAADDDEYGPDDRKSPADGLEKPVREVGSKVITELLPKAVDGVGGASVLSVPGMPGVPGQGAGLEGLTSLVKGFGLR